MYLHLTKRFLLSSVLMEYFTFFSHIFLKRGYNLTAWSYSNSSLCLWPSDNWPRTHRKIALLLSCSHLLMSQQGQDYILASTKKVISIPPTRTFHVFLRDQQLCIFPSSKMLCEDSFLKGTNSTLRNFIYSTEPCLSIFSSSKVIT